MKIDLPPTLNQSYYVRRWGRTCPCCGKREKAGLGLTAEAVAFKEEIAWRAKSEFGHLDPKGTYELRLVQHLPRNSRDFDANVKLVADGVALGVGINDNRIFRGDLEKVVDGERYLEIMIKSCPDNDPGEKADDKGNPERNDKINNSI